MAIYDINGNVILNNNGSSGNIEISNNSITPEKTTFFNEELTYKLIDLGTIEDGLIYSGGSLSNSTAYRRTADFVKVNNDVDKIYSANNPSGMSRILCYDANKQFLGEGETAIEYVSGSSMQETALLDNTCYIKCCFSAETNNYYVSYNKIPYPFEVTKTDFSCRNNYDKRLWDALGIPNLDAISRFKGKTMIVAGDSITEKNQTADVVWHDNLKEWLGLTVYNDGQGGTGFAKNFYGRGSTIYRVENNWETLYPAEPDIILIMGNMNDGTGGGGGYAEVYPEGDTGMGTPPPVGTSNDDSAVFSQYGVVRRLLESLIERYPTAKIGMISSTPRDSDVSHWSENSKSYGCNGWYEDYITAQKYVCEDMNVPFLDLYHNNVLRPWNTKNVETFYWDGTDESLTQDGYTGAVHPNSNGHLEGIAKPVLQWMLQWM